MINNEQNHDNVAMATDTENLDELVIVAHYRINHLKNMVFSLVEKSYKNYGIRSIFPSAHVFDKSKNREEEDDLNKKKKKHTDLFLEISLNKTGRIMKQTDLVEEFIYYENGKPVYRVYLYVIEEAKTEEWVLQNETIIPRSFEYITQKGYMTTPLTQECAQKVFNFINNK